MTGNNLLRRLKKGGGLALLALLLALRSTPVSAQVAFDAEANVGCTATAATTCTITGKTTAGSNRVGIIACAWNNETPVITGATWNGSSTGVAIIDQGAEVTNASLGAALIRAIAPPTGASNIVITWNAAATGQCVASSYNGVDQATPVSATNKVITTTTLVTPITNTVTTAANEVIVDAVSFTKFDGSETMSVDAGQTQIGNTFYATFYQALSSRQSGGSGGVMSWSFTNGGNGSYVSIASSLKAAGGATASCGGLGALGVGCDELF